MIKHFIAVAVLVVLVTVAITLAFGGIDSIVPTQASEEAAVVDRLLGIELYLIIFLFSLVVVIMVYSIIVFRRKPGEEETEGTYFRGNTKLEILWTLVPLVTVLTLATLSAQYLGQIERPEENELVVKVTGFQWDWRFEYPEYGITSNELNLPAGRQTRFEMTSLDVIHSFWVPEFRIKKDAVPGLVTELRVKPTQVGQYVVRCAEMCGTRHAYMNRTVNVLEASAFDTWLSDAQTAAEDMTPVELGAKLASEQGCLSCHSVDGTEMVGPTWQGLFGSERPLQDGTTAVADEEYLHTAIVDPNTHVAQGFPAGVMPQDYEERLTEEQINALVEYIKSLGE